MLYIKRITYRDLSDANKDYLSEWDEMSRDFKRNANGYETVYKMRESKGMYVDNPIVRILKIDFAVPSRRQLRTEAERLSDEDEYEDGDSPQRHTSVSMSFLGKGIEILHAQWVMYISEDLTTTNTIIRKRTSYELNDVKTSGLEDKHPKRLLTLRRQLISWRSEQKILMPEAEEHIAIFGVDFDDKYLLSRDLVKMPSDLLECDVEFSSGLLELAKMEVRLREAELLEILGKLRDAVRMLDARRHEQIVHSRGQNDNTRASAQRSRLKKKIQLYIELYNESRESLQALERKGLDVTMSFPRLSLEDTVRKNPELRRHLGTSRQVDGSLWRGSIGSRSFSRLNEELLDPDGMDEGAYAPVRTMTKRKTSESVTSHMVPVRSFVAHP